MLRSTTANYDDPWKAALDDYFDAFLFLPLALALRLNNQGLTREGIIRLFQLIDRIMALPNPLQERLEAKL